MDSLPSTFDSMKHSKESEPTFSVNMMRMPDGTITSVPSFDKEPIPTDGFDEGTTLAGHFELSGQTYHLDRVAALLKAAEELDDGQMYRFLSELVDETRKWVMENEMTGIRQKDES